MFKPVLQAVQMFLKGATGKDRQDKQHLSEHLLTLQVAYDQLQQQHDQLQQQHDTLQQAHTLVLQQCDRLQQSQRDLAQRLQLNKADLDAFINVADTDAKALELANEDLQQRLRDSEAEKETLQHKNSSLVGEVAVLQHQLELRDYQTADGNKSSEEKEDVAPSVTEQSTGAIDLSDISLALIGGHETTYREVTKALSQYGLKTCVHVPPHSVASSDRNQIKDKISNCDLIVTITSYVDHSVAKCVKSLKDAQMLAGECIRVSCHGKSGLVREVLQYFQEPLQSS